jgi:hypothetical protein
MNENREEICKCELCLKPIYAGDRYSNTDDGVSFCEEHAYCLSDVVEQHAEILAMVPWQPGELDYSSRAEMLTAYFRMKADLEANGDRKLLVEA